MEEPRSYWECPYQMVVSFLFFSTILVVIGTSLIPDANSKQVFLGNWFTRGRENSESSRDVITQLFVPLHETQAVVAIFGNDKFIPGMFDRTILVTVARTCKTRFCRLSSGWSSLGVEELNNWLVVSMVKRGSG